MSNNSLIKKLKNKRVRIDMKRRYKIIKKIKEFLKKRRINLKDVQVILCNLCFVEIALPNVIISYMIIIKVMR